MRLKTIIVGGRYLGAKDNMVMTRGGVPELSFEQLDDIVARMEVLENLQPDEPLASWRAPVTESSTYPAEIIREGDEVLLTFGCWTVGNTARVKETIARLRELNKDPDIQPAPGVYEMPNGRGIFLKVDKNGYIQTVSEDGIQVYDTIMTMAKANEALAVMEERSKIKLPPTPTDVIVDGIGDQVYLRYACQTLNLAEVKQVLEALNKPVVPNAQPS